MADRKFPADNNVEIVRLTLDWPLPCVEPRLLCLEIHPPMAKRRREIAYGCVLRIRRNDTSRIIVVMPLVDRLVEGSDVGFIFRCLTFQFRGAHVVFPLL